MGPCRDAAFETPAERELRITGYVAAHTTPEPPPQAKHIMTPAIAAVIQLQQQYSGLRTLLESALAAYDAAPSPDTAVVLVYTVKTYLGQQT